MLNLSNGPLMVAMLVTVCLVACSPTQQSSTVQNADPDTQPQSSEPNSEETFAADAEAETEAGPRPSASAQTEGTENSTSAATNAVSEAPKLLSNKELAEGWIALFDGHTLFGWEAANEANWRVEDGAIIVDDGEVGLLCTSSRFGDYVLKLEFRSAPSTNSGIFLHTPKQPQDPASDCYELNIADSDNPFPTGSLVRRAKSEGNFDSGDWQAYEITVQAGRVTVLLDGQEVLNYTDPSPLSRGHIGLQLNQGQVQFRNIKLRPLGLGSIFNGQDLTGWKSYPDMSSEFSITEAGELNVKNGSGQLETEHTYGDFVFQLECIAHAADLNSGIFFRCIPGEKMNGYESQIHNGFENGDRRQPKDCGTGGIFRRQNARLVVADDLQWFHKTIIADGPHMAAWVNGYQVSDWTDTRQPNENPRRGLRVEPGTIMIQGHDPTTNLSFRNLRIAETVPRRSEQPVPQ